MKVAFVSQPMDGVLPPYQNSIGISTYEMAKRVSRICDVIVYIKTDEYKKKYKIINGVHYCSVPTIYDNKIQKIKEKLLKCNKKKFEELRYSYYFLYAVIVSLDLKKKKCDLVQIYNFSQFVPIVRFFNPKIKIILNMRCEWLSQIDSSYIWKRIKKVDKITSCSEYITNKIKKSFPEISYKCKTIYNGVDTNVFLPEKPVLKKQNETNTFYKLLFVGRGSPEKGVHILLEAFSIVLRDTPNVQLDIVGSRGKVPFEYLVGLHDDKSKVYELKKFYEEGQADSYYRYCEELAKSLGIADKVNFLGGQTYDKMAEIYRKTDVVVNPSYSESFGRSLIEAMASGKPVIASRVGGMTEIINGSGAGLLFEAGDVAAFANLIGSLLKNKKMRENMGCAGRKRVEEVFCWDCVFENLYKVFKELVN